MTSTKQTREMNQALRTIRKALIANRAAQHQADRVMQSIRSARVRQGKTLVYKLEG